MTEFAPASRFDTGPTKPEFAPATRFDRGPQTQPKPRFTEEELSPYRKVAEPGFGQKYLVFDGLHLKYKEMLLIIH